LLLADTADADQNPAPDVSTPSTEASQDSGNPGSEVYRVGGGVSAPQALYAPDPEYSKEARKAKYQGTVVLWLVVDANGLPQEIRVQRSLGLGLDEQAVAAVQRWSFEPSKKDGKPVAVMINVEVNFRYYEELVPHPESKGEPPRFPGVNTSEYPLLVRLAASSQSPVASSTMNYTAMVAEAGQEREVSISCSMGATHCWAFQDGTYPAKWQIDKGSLEILGQRGHKGKWEKAKYVVEADPKTSPAPTGTPVRLVPSRVTNQSNRSDSDDDRNGAVHVSQDNLTGGGLVHKVAPVYPIEARRNKIAGNVQLQVTIGTDGQVYDLKCLSGPEELIPAAIEAVKQWRYNPFFMDGKPVEVRTDISVNFTLE
jgi:TonB family protein